MTAKVSTTIHGTSLSISISYGAIIVYQALCKLIFSCFLEARSKYGYTILLQSKKTILSGHTMGISKEKRDPKELTGLINVVGEVHHGHKNPYFEVLLNVLDGSNLCTRVTIFGVLKAVFKGYFNKPVILKNISHNNDKRWYTEKY